MNKNVAICLLCVSAGIAAVAIGVWKGVDTAPQPQQQHDTAEPVGRSLSDQERSLSQQATIELTGCFPDYRLPLDQDRLSDLLRQAVTDEDVDQVNRLLATGTDVNWRDGHDLPPLFLAIRQNRPDMVAAMIRHGADITVADPIGRTRIDLSLNAWGQTPLYFAARLGHRQMVDLLLRSGVDIHSRNVSGKSVIVAAIERGDSELFDYLLQQGAECDFVSGFSVDERVHDDSVVNPDAKRFPPPFQETIKSYWRLLDLARACQNDELIHTVNKLHSEWVKENPVDVSKSWHSAVLRGDIVTVRELLAQGHQPTFEEHGWNLLHFSARHGHAEICGLLIDAGLNVNAKTKGQTERLPIHFAIESGSVETVKLLRQRGAELVPTEWLEGKRSYQSSPLYLAVTAEKPKMVQYLIDCGQSLDDPKTMVTAMASVTRPSAADQRSPSVQIAKILIQSGIQLQPDYPGNEPEYLIADRGRFDLFKMIELRKDVTYDDALLRAAVRGGNVELCRHVMAKGAKLKHDPAEDESLVRMAMVQHRNPELIDLLFEAGVAKTYPRQYDVSKGYSRFHEYGHPLYHAALAGDVAFCRYLMRNFPASQLWQPLQYDPYEYDSDIEFFSQGNTPLFAAVFGDHVQVMELFLTDQFKTDSGEVLLDIDAANRIGATALHEAVNFGAARSVQLLLASGADPLVPRRRGELGDGNTPLHLAIHHSIGPHMYPSWTIEPQRPRIFPMLAAVAKTRDLNWMNVRNQKGQTILHQFARAGHLAICQSLVELGADANAVDENGTTALHAAIQGNGRYYMGRKSEARTKLCIYLGENGTTMEQPEAPPQLKYFREAAIHHLFDFCAYLSSQGIQPDIEHNQGPLLCAAARAGQQELLVQLLEMGADVNETDYEQKTAMHHAVEARVLAICTLLVGRGADVNAKDSDGRTPLFSVFDRYDTHWARFNTADPEATRKQMLPILQLLLDSGADAAIQSNRGKTVVQRYSTMPDEFRTLLEEPDAC